MIVIRPWTPHDGGEPARIVKAVYDEYGFDWHPDGYCADLYDVGRHYIEQGHFFWMAEVDGVPVGTAALELFVKIPVGVLEVDGMRRIGGASCSLERLYLLKEARGQGIGARLFEQTIMQASELRCEIMEIWSDKEFEDAHRLYMKYGGEVIGDRLCDDPNQSPEYGIRLEIAAAMARIEGRRDVQ